MFGMFTRAGNSAVAAICEKTVSVHSDCTVAYNYTLDELRKLSEVHTFREAMDTEVREQVWLYIQRNMKTGVTPVFRTTRKKAA